MVLMHREYQHHKFRPYSERVSSIGEWGVLAGKVIPLCTSSQGADSGQLKGTNTHHSGHMGRKCSN